MEILKHDEALCLQAAKRLVKLIVPKGKLDKQFIIALARFLQLGCGDALTDAPAQVRVRPLAAVVLSPFPRTL